MNELDRYKEELKKYTAPESNTVAEGQKNRYRTAVTEMISLLSELGYSEMPDNEDIYNEYRRRRKSIGGKGDTEANIEIKVTRIKKFFKDIKGGATQMTINTEDNAIKTEEATTPEAEVKTLESSETSTDNREQGLSNPVIMDNQQPRTPGRPKTTERATKFTLYMTDATMKKLTLLADYDEVNITDLINDILTDFFATRQEDLEFLNSLEEQKQARRLTRKGNDR